MQSLTLTIPTTGFAATDGYRLYGNVDRYGRAIAAIDFDSPIRSDAVRPFFGQGDTLATQRVDATPLLYLGWYGFAIKTFDTLGNVLATTPPTFAVYVNSGPRPLKRFKHTTTTSDGRPVFAITVPTQLEAVA